MAQPSRRTQMRRINPDTAPAGAGRRQLNFDIHMISAEDLGKLGMTQLAYVKAVTVNGAPGFAIHAADGTPMAVTEDRDVALAAIIQHEMLPSLVH
jgi:hypothetical protein